jgi:hypothetical protein
VGLKPVIGAGLQGCVRSIVFAHLSYRAHSKARFAASPMQAYSEPIENSSYQAL